MKVSSLLADLQQQEDKLLQQMKLDLRSGRSSVVHESVERWAVLTHQMEVLHSLLPRESKASHLFVFSSVMLLQSYKYCVQTRDEWLHYILGIDFDHAAIGTHIVTMPLAKQSPVGALADTVASNRIMAAAHFSGHRVIAMIHSHPGTGPRANEHSSIDEATQKAWECANRTVGAIWSRDGYLRFYSHQMPYTIEILGDYFTKVEGEENVWKAEKEGLEVLESLGSGISSGPDRRLGPGHLLEEVDR